MRDEHQWYHDSKAESVSVLRHHPAENRFSDEHDVEDANYTDFFGLFTRWWLARNRLVRHYSSFLVFDPEQCLGNESNCYSELKS